MTQLMTTISTGLSKRRQEPALAFSGDLLALVAAPRRL